MKTSNQSRKESVSVFAVLFSLTAATSLLACQKKASDSSVPMVTTHLSVTASSSAKTIAKSSLEKWMAKLIPSATAYTAPSFVDSASNSLTVSQLWIVLKEIEFKAAETKGQEDSSESGEAVEFHGPYVADLLSPTAPVLDTKSIPSKTYKRIKLQYEKVDTSKLPAAAPAALANNSIYLTGSAGGYNFTYSMNDGIELEISTPNGMAAAEGQNMLLNLQLANALRKIDFTALNALASGANRDISSSNRITGTHLCDSVDSNASQDYYTCFKKSIESESNFGQDDNNDGDLESTEHSSRK